MDGYTSLLSAFDRLVQKWDESQHPRDWRGRFSDGDSVGQEPGVEGKVVASYFFPKGEPRVPEPSPEDKAKVRAWLHADFLTTLKADVPKIAANIRKLETMGVGIKPLADVPFQTFGGSDLLMVAEHSSKQIESVEYLDEKAPLLTAVLRGQVSLSLVPTPLGHGSYHSGGSKLIANGTQTPEGWRDRVADGTAYRDGLRSANRNAEPSSWGSKDYMTAAMTHELAHALDYNTPMADGRPYGISREFNKVLLRASKAEGGESTGKKRVLITEVREANPETGTPKTHVASWEERESKYKNMTVADWCERKMGPYSNKVYTTRSGGYWGKNVVRPSSKGLRVERWSMACSMYIGPDYKPGYFPREVEEFIEKKTGFRRSQVQKYDSILKGDLPGHPFRGNQYVPGEPGSTPIKPGFVRLFHQTSLENAASIRENGLLLSKAQGIEGPRAIYAAPTPFYGDPGGLALVEIQIPEKDFLAPYFVTGDRRQGVPPEEIIAVHEPWHHHVRYFEEPDNAELLQRVLDGKEDSLIPADRSYGPAIAYVKAKYGKQAVKKAAGPAPVPYGSRDIPSACLYCAHREPGYVGIGTSMDMVAACCKAFPDGISSLVYRGDSHLSPIPGDRGVLFKLADGAPLPPWMKQ